MEGSVLAANVVMSAGRQRTGRSFDGGGGATARRLPCERSARLSVQGSGWCAGTTLDGAGGGGRRQEPRRGCGRWPDGSPDAARLGGSLQCRGSGGADRPNVAGPAAKADAGAEAGAAAGG